MGYLIVKGELDLVTAYTMALKKYYEAAIRVHRRNATYSSFTRFLEFEALHKSWQESKKAVATEAELVLAKWIS